MARDRATDTATLVAAAAEVIRVKGYHNTTIDDIAEAVGISRPTVYKYIESKQWLLDQMVDTLARQFDARLHDLTAAVDDPVARLRLTITTVIVSAVENRTLYGIAFSEQAELSEDGLQRFNEWAHQVTVRFKQLLDDCRAAESAPAGLNTWIAANLMLSMLSSLYRWYDPNGPVDLPALTDQVLLVVGAVSGRSDAVGAAP